MSIATEIDKTGATRCATRPAFYEELSASLIEAIATSSAGKEISDGKCSPVFAPSRGTERGMAERNSEKLRCIRRSTFHTFSFSRSASLFLVCVHADVDAVPALFYFPRAGKKAERKRRNRGRGRTVFLVGESEIGRLHGLHACASPCSPVLLPVA